MIPVVEKRGSILNGCEVDDSVEERESDEVEEQAGTEDGSSLRSDGGEEEVGEDFVKNVVREREESDGR